MEGLRAEGYIIDQNMTIQWRHAEGKAELFPVFADELIKLPVDILIAGTSGAAVAAKAATATVPILMLGCADPLDYGLIKDYTRHRSRTSQHGVRQRSRSDEADRLFHGSVPGSHWCCRRRPCRQHESDDADRALHRPTRSGCGSPRLNCGSDEDLRER